MNGVDFFLVGAPKCGTTSLFEYLSEHPGICLSDSKEPNFFSKDLSGYINSRTLDEYLRKEFKHCVDENKLNGECSVIYLYSKQAAEEIYKYNKNAKIIIMLRNQVNMLPSYHSQLVYNLDEDVEDFERAWFLQKKRCQGYNLPKHCREPKLLQYRDVGKYSVQIARYLRFFPREQIKVILFDDFSRNTEAVYKEVVSFLGLIDDGRKIFQVSNRNKVLLSKKAAGFLYRPPHFLVSFIKFLKRILKINRFGVYVVLDKLNALINARETQRTPLRNGFKQIIINEFREDNKITEELIGLDLRAWKES